MRTDQYPDAIPVPADTAPEIFHQWCPRVGSHIAMCGLDIRHLPFTDGVGEQECAVCFGIDDDYCPFSAEPCTCAYEGDEPGTSDRRPEDGA